MNVDSILLSEYAKSDEAGRLTVVNCFNRLTTPQAPVGIEILCISLVVHGSPSEAGSQHQGEIRLLNQRREVLNEKPVPFGFRFAGPEGLDPGMPVRWIGSFRILRLVLPEFGPYAFEVYIDGTYHAAASLYVRQQEE